MKRAPTRYSLPLSSWQTYLWELPLENKLIVPAKASRTIELAPLRLLVLVVDDSAIVRRRLRQLLGENDCVRQVSEAANGAEAWFLFQELAPDVVLLDLHLPDTSGLEVLSRIKRAAPSCLVIILTNHRDSIFRLEAQRGGADYFLHKATEFERVGEILHRHAKGVGRISP